MLRKRSYQTWTATLAVCWALFPLSHQAAAEDLSKDYTWKPVHIGSGGFVRGLAVNPNQAGVLYARADVDNIYRFDDAGQRWVPLKVASAFGCIISGAPTSGAEGALAEDPNNPNVVLVAYTFTRSNDLANTNPSINMNVYRSANGGRTFKPGNLSLPNSLTNETRGERLVIDPNNSNLVYFGTPGNGPWRSLDGGKLRLRLGVGSGQVRTRRKVSRHLCLWTADRRPSMGRLPIDRRRAHLQPHLLLSGRDLRLPNHAGGKLGRLWHRVYRFQRQQLRVLDLQSATLELSA